MREFFKDVFTLIKLLKYRLCLYFLFLHEFAHAYAMRRYQSRHIPYIVIGHKSSEVDSNKKEDHWKKICNKETLFGFNIYFGKEWKDTICGFADIEDRKALTSEDVKKCASSPVYLFSFLFATILLIVAYVVIYFFTHREYFLIAINNKFILLTFIIISFFIFLILFLTGHEVVSFFSKDDYKIYRNPERYYKYGKEE